VKTFPKEVDDLWDIIRYRYTFAVKRDSHYLNWKFVKQPHINFQKYLVYHEGRLAGILVFRKAKDRELSIGIISEFYTDQGSHFLGEMLHFAISKLYRQGASMIQCVSSTRERSHILSSFGFIPLKTFRGAFSFLTDVAHYTNVVKNGQWLITLGDHDLDEYGKKYHPSLLSLLRALLGKN